MTPDEIATLETTTVDICKAHRTENWRKGVYSACVFVDPCYFVKYGDPEGLGPEIATQNYIFNYAKSHPGMSGVPRIPEVKHWFQKERTMYLIMERITLTEFESHRNHIQRVAEALKWLSEVKPPPGHVIGPLGGGLIRHKVFNTKKAPFLFPSVDALERYLKRAYTMLPRQTKKETPPVKISNDRLMFTQSDMDLSNFGVDEQGKTVLMDFAEIGVLPETFVAYTMAYDYRLDPIISSLGLSSDPNTSMTHISGYLVMISDPTLGLNEYGYFVKGGGK